MPTEDKIEELKALIVSELGPEFVMDKLNYDYEPFDHAEGQCDYDPYDKYDSEYQDEIFGLMQSEDESDPEFLQACEEAKDQESAECGVRTPVTKLLDEL